MFVPAHVERTPEQRIVEAAAVLSRGEAVTGWAALRWEGALWFDGTGSGTEVDVPLVATRHLVSQPGFSVSQEFLAPRDVRLVEGIPITSRVRSVLFEMRRATSLGDAIVALDMACYADLVSVDEVAGHLARMGPVTGVGQARDAVIEAEENSWSPRETRMRGLWTRRAGLPRPLCNRAVFTLDGRFVGTPDVVDPDLGLIGQYNGSDHVSAVGMTRDVRQDAAYRELGLETVTMVAADWADISGFVRRLHAAHERAVARAAPARWTVEPPPWWTPTWTVAQRRALAGAQRERLLRYRRAA